MGLIPALFGIACGAAILLASHSRDAHAMFLAVVLTCVWALSNLAWATAMLDLFPIMDLMIACYAFVMVLYNQSGWKIAFLMITFAQLLLHLCYALLGSSFTLGYFLLLNVTFAMELFAISWEGLINVGSWLHRRFCRLRLVRASVPKGKIGG